jgi:hypothetical protein
MISPEALENGRASDGSRENIVMGDIDDDTAVITTGGMMGSIAAALQAERDAAAPKLPDDLAGLVERLEEPGAVCWSDVTDARTTIQSLVARNAELEAGIRGIAEGNLGDEPGQANYARIKSVACSLLNKDRQP